MEEFFKKINEEEEITRDGKTYIFQKTIMEDGTDSRTDQNKTILVLKLVSVK